LANAADNDYAQINPPIASQASPLG
jgi:hypothetical protein